MCVCAHRSRKQANNTCGPLPWDPSTLQRVGHNKTSTGGGASRKRSEIGRELSSNVCLLLRSRGDLTIS